MNENVDNFVGGNQDRGTTEESRADSKLASLQHLKLDRSNPARISIQLFKLNSESNTSFKTKTSIGFNFWTPFVILFSR